MDMIVTEAIDWWVAFSDYDWKSFLNCSGYRNADWAKMCAWFYQSQRGTQGSEMSALIPDSNLLMIVSYVFGEYCCL